MKKLLVVALLCVAGSVYARCGCGCKKSCEPCDPCLKPVTTCEEKPCCVKWVKKTCPARKVCEKVTREVMVPKTVCDTNCHYECPDDTQREECKDACK